MRVCFRREHTPVCPLCSARCLMMKRILSLLLALLTLFSFAAAEEALIVTVNGEDLLYSDYTAIEAAYLYQYEAAGVNLTDPETYAYLQDLALTYAIEQMLIRQDMHAQGCYAFTEEEEAWFAEQGKTAYDAALQDVINSLRTAETTEDELMVYALAYAKSLNVTEQTYVDFYRTQYASAKYYEWLIRDNPVTDEDVQASYDKRVAQSKALYENNVAAFEAALNNGSDVWYKPAGYRSILQILLPATGDTEEAKLLSVQSTVDDIYARLEKGESFQRLIAEYGTDANCKSEAFLATGYQVHQESVVWEDAFIAAAFSADMAQPGSVSKPFASEIGVHILCYLCDSSSGPIELTEDLHTALASALYTERYTAAQTQRVNDLAGSAEIIFH